MGKYHVSSFLNTLVKLFYIHPFILSVLNWKTKKKKKTVCLLKDFKLFFKSQIGSRKGLPRNTSPSPRHRAIPASSLCSAPLTLQEQPHFVGNEAIKYVCLSFLSFQCPLLCYYQGVMCPLLSEISLSSRSSELQV